MKQSLKIGGVNFDNNIFLAPMAGVTSLSFRVICKRHGASLVYSEMVSAKGIYYNNANTANLLKIAPEERPSAIQLFGCEPEVLAYTAKKISENNNFDIIDINMGCPAPKIVKNGEGSALMKNPALIGEIVRAVSSAVKIPVTVKIRKGFDKANAVEVAKIIEQNGAAAITIHGRTRSEQYSGLADWDIIKRVKGSVKIPVIGNGDVTSPEKALKMLSETGCDAVMIGRAAQGDPWIFKRALHYIETGRLLPQPSIEEKIETALAHTKMEIAEKGEFTGIMEMRKHLCWYIKGLPCSSEAKVKINSALSYNEIECILNSILN